MQELNAIEIDEVSGGIVPVVLWKIGAFAIGAACGAGLVVAVTHLLD